MESGLLIAIMVSMSIAGVIKAFKNGIGDGIVCLLVPGAAMTYFFYNLMQGGPAKVPPVKEEN